MKRAAAAEMRAPSRRKLQPEFAAVLMTVRPAHGAGGSSTIAAGLPPPSGDLPARPEDGKDAQKRELGPHVEEIARIPEKNADCRQRQAVFKLEPAKEQMD